MKGPAIITLVAMICIAGGIFPTLLGDVGSLTGDHTGVVLAESVFTVSGDENYYQITTQNDNIDPDTFRSWYIYNDELIDIDYSNYDYNNGVFKYFIENSVLYLDGTYDSDSGVFVDQSGNGNHGTPYNGATTGTGVVGDGMSFDGVDDYIQTTNFPIINNDNCFSYHFWCNTTTPTVYHTFFHRNDAITTETLWISRRDIGNKLVIQMRPDAGGSAFTLEFNNFFVGVSESCFIGIVVNTSTGDVSTYKNGVLFDILTFPASVMHPTSINPQFIGCTSGLTYHGLFIFDEIRIYDRGISEDEITALYNLESFNPELPVGSEIYCSYEYNDTFSPIGSDLFRYGISGIGVVLLIVAGIYSTRS